ncbi:MAG TPA: hypothetical protein VLE97_05935 [Gaiellaceae bacterium]|nr:hypothetical protein [Gaiellaceae bacterium]
MTLSADQIAETIEVARGFLADRASPTYGDKGVAGEFAQALVQVADACVVGLPCERHYGAIHGGEAEELRAGLEKLMREAERDAIGSRTVSVFALQRLIDEVAARDSLAFREATDPPDGPDAPSDVSRAE